MPIHLANPSCILQHGPRQCLFGCHIRFVLKPKYRTFQLYFSLHCCLKKPLTLLCPFGTGTVVDYRLRDRLTNWELRHKIKSTKICFNSRKDGLIELWCVMILLMLILDIKKRQNSFKSILRGFLIPLKLESELSLADLTG